MADKPPRPILHLKFPSSEPADPDAPAPKPPAPRPLMIAPATRVTRPTVREFTPAKSTRPPRLARPPRIEPEPKPKQNLFAWKCKPCGKGFDVAAELADEDSVRCPSCNARLGLARDFRSDPPNLDKVRARAVAKS
jgi:DNA-directed RNA polymerase subunit RPC12/RpoP